MTMSLSSHLHQSLNGSGELKRDHGKARQNLGQKCHSSQTKGLLVPPRQTCHSSRYSSKVQATHSEVVTDQAVPEGHKGLHEFLYGEGGAEAHDAPQVQIQAREDEDCGAVQVSVEDYLTGRFLEKRAGAYAVYGKDGGLQYIGYARSVVAAIKGHLAGVGEEKCFYLRTRLLSTTKMASRNLLQQEADKWLAELEESPPGNSDERYLWEAKAMMQTDKGTFQEKKLKLQKAMGEKLNDVSVEQVSDADRRDRLKKAMTEDDWSSVIDEQTEEAIANNTPAAAIDQIPPVSPFTRPNSLQNTGAEVQQRQVLSIESADKVLDNVRPYLIADGGNVEVVSTDDGIVQLRLQGACGTCASSSATMKMGLEKALKDAFGEDVKEVKQVDAKDNSTSVSAINSHLDMLRPAIKSYGGTVQVVGFENGEAVVAYKGPPTIATGISAAIKGQFGDVSSVKMIDP